MKLDGKRVAVTGGAGFLGRVVVERLKQRGADVVVPRKKDFDFTLAQDAARFYESEKPSAVMHLAAEVGGIGANRDNPGRFFYANMAMGLNLIEEGRKSGIEKFLHVGTICEYPKHTPVPFKEADLWSGYPEETNAPYGIAKKALGVMLQAYHGQYGLIGNHVLPVNLYGPHDNFDPASSHVIPALIRKCVEARQAGDSAVEVWGTGKASREFLYVDDCADGLVAAMEKLDEAEPLNLGTGEEITIGDLAKKIAALCGFNGKLDFDSEKPDGQPRRCLDTTAAKEKLGFQAKTSLEDGLKKTIEWYQATLSY